MATFNYVFGGDPVQPAQVAYRSFTITPNLALEWPWAEQDTDDIAAVIMDVAASADEAQTTFTMPPANQASVGQPALVRNVGGVNITVQSGAGDAIATISPGVAKYIWITENSDVGGTWAEVTFGAGASQADAASLAGFGLRARAAFLDQNHPVEVIITDTMIDDTYRARVVTVSPNVGSGTLTFPSITTLSNGFFFLFSNLGTGAWTLEPDGSETIDNQPSISLNPLESCEVHVGSDGLYTIGRGRNTTFSFTQNNQNVGGNVSVVLSTTQAGNFIQNFFGVLTGSINVIVPNAVQPYIVANNTTGAFSLTVKTAAGTGLVIPQGETTWIYCDGTDVLDADTVIPTAPSLDMPDGSAAAPGLAFTNDLNTGFFRPGNDILAVTTGGTERARFTTAGLEVTGSIEQSSTDIRMLMTVLG